MMQFLTTALDLKDLFAIRISGHKSRGPIFQIATKYKGKNGTECFDYDSREPW